MMEPDTKDNKNDEDSSTKYILEYYRKYSQDKKLPKYFSGTSIAYLPEIVDDDAKKSNSDININVEIPTEDQSKKADELELSPTGSIGSNKKLEWDNLADIGYDNAQSMHRSSSLPIFSQFSKKNDCANSEFSKSGGSNVKVIIYPYLSSSEEKSADANAEYSSYSPIDNKDLTPKSSTSSSVAKGSLIISDNSSSEDKVSSFRQTLDYLKTKIGVPDAHSTPCESKFQIESIEKMSGTKIHVPDAQSTPCESKFQMESIEKMSGTKIDVPDAHSTPCESKFQMESIEKMSGTKICVPDAHSTQCESKFQMESIEKMSGTPVSTNHGKPVKQLINPSKNTKITPKNAETQTNKILDIQDNYSTKLTSGKACEQPPSNLKRKVVNLCLTKPVLLDCISEKINKTRLTIGIQTESTSKVKDKLHQLIPMEKLSDSKKTHIEAAKSSSSNGLASNCDSFEYIKPTKEEPIIKVNEQSNKDEKQMYEKSESSQDVKVIETTSKKACNDIEHTLYVLQKLLRSKKYDSSTKKKYINKILQKLMESRNLEDSSTSSELFYPKTDSSRILKDQIKKSFKNEGSSSSYQSNENKKFSPSKRKPELTKTQKPCKETKIGLSKKMESSLLLSPKKKNSKTGTLDNFANLLTTEFIPEKDKETRKGPFTLSTTHCDNSSHEEKYFSSSTTKSYENWKELQTNSELTFASNGKSLVGDGDHISIHFAEKERQFQLNWIDREINHLGKLKSLLEKPRTPFEEGRKITTTSVYVVSGCDNGKNNVPRRNYVIETELGVKGPQPRNFCLNGENYTVRDPQIQETGKHKKSQPAVANIEVHSDEKTTNIKVKTYCSVCKNAPCICKSILDNLQTLGNDEKPCCSTRSSGKYSEKRTQRSDKNSCVVCGYVSCVCNNGNDKTESKSCSVCQSSPSICNCETQSSTLQNPCYSVPVKGYAASPNGKEKEIEFCLCELGLSDDKSSSSNDNQSGSLGKIFKDCRCDAKTECNCDFVSKLLKHFSTRQTDTSKTLQNCGIQVTPPTNICFKQTDTCSKDQPEQKECSPDYLCSLISRIEAFFDKNGKKRACTRSTTNKGTTTKSLDRSTTCSPPRVECVPDVPLYQCCPNKSSEIDKGTTCSPVKVLCDQSTTYSPPVEQCTCKPSVNDDTITKTCTPDTCLFNKQTANQETCYEPPEDPCNCDEPSESKLQKDKNGKETLCLQVSKDVKSIDMSFCLCASKKNSGKGDKNEDGDKKKKHKKQCKCKCDHCASIKESSSNSTSKGDSNKPRVCRCSSKSTKKDHICCCQPKTNENSNEDTTADTLSTNTTDATPILVCSLCNRTTSYAKLSVLRTNDEEYALCSECVGKRPILTTTCYAGPDLESDSRPLSAQSHTATDGFQQVDSYCTCPKGTSSKKNQFDYCLHCRNQLRRTLKSRNGIAYTLTLEDEPLERCRYRKSKKKPKLKEIKVKVPCPYHRKNVKNQENVHRKDENRIKELESGEVSEQNENCRCESDVDEMNKNAANKSNKDYTLQEYLKKNRPDFIDSAEYRRQTVLNNRVGREEIKDDLKLRFLNENDNNNLKRQKNKLFTEQEMREITKRNYKKLPEIQNKATLLRLQKLRNADKYITDVFKKKIQNCILKGKSNFPIDSNIVNYYK